MSDITNLSEAFNILKKLNEDSEILDSKGNLVDPEIASLLKSSKIRNRSGQLILCYHGTNAQFDEFKDDLIGSSSGNIGWYGKGFYFTDSEKLAKSYGTIQRKCYLNITKPFIYYGKDSVWDLLSLGYKDIRTYNDKLQPFSYLDKDKEYMVEDFTKLLKEAGYDGVKASYKQGNYKPNIPGVSNASEYVCFNSNQIIWVD